MVQKTEQNHRRFIKNIFPDSWTVTCSIFPNISRKAKPDALAYQTDASPALEIARLSVEISRRTIPMESTMAQKHSVRLLAEMSEFGTFSAAEQRYIRRSLDVGFNRLDAVERWSRNIEEVAAIGVQARRYRTLNLVRACMPDDVEIDAVESFVGPLIALAAYDLSEGKIASFAAFRFLYERLVGAMARPWLPSVFCAAAALPQLHPEQRKLLLQSVRGFDAAAHGWSILEPLFYPEWVEKVAEVVN